MYFFTLLVHGHREIVLTMLTLITELHIGIHRGIKILDGIVELFKRSHNDFLRSLP